MPPCATIFRVLFNQIFNNHKKCLFRLFQLNRAKWTHFTKKNCSAETAVGRTGYQKLWVGKLWGPVPVTGQVSLYEAGPPYQRPCLPVTGPVSLWEALSPCERLGLFVRVPASLGEARPPWERPGLPVRGHKMQFCRENNLRFFYCCKKEFRTLIFF